MEYRKYREYREYRKYREYILNTILYSAGM